MPIKINDKTTIQVFQQLLRSKLESFRWETMHQVEAYAMWNDIRLDLENYYVRIRIRNNVVDTQPKKRIFSNGA